MLGLIFFGWLSLVLVGAAIGVITSRNPVYSALFLVLAFVTSAILWLLLEAEFLAMTLILVYVGAVMVLFLFVIMMMDINVARLRAGFTRYAPLGLLVAGITIGDDSSPDALSDGPSISAQLSRSIKLWLKRKFRMPCLTLPSST